MSVNSDGVLEKLIRALGWDKVTSVIKVKVREHVTKGPLPCLITRDNVKVDRTGRYACPPFKF